MLKSGESLVVRLTSIARTHGLVVGHALTNAFANLFIDITPVLSLCSERTDADRIGMGGDLSVLKVPDNHRCSPACGNS